jgi:hypothetical protein
LRIKAEAIFFWFRGIGRLKGQHLYLCSSSPNLDFHLQPSPILMFHYTYPEVQDTSFKPMISTLRTSVSNQQSQLLQGWVGFFHTETETDRNQIPKATKCSSPGRAIQRISLIEQIIPQFTRVSRGPKGYKYLSQVAVDCRNVWRIRIFAA